MIRDARGGGNERERDDESIRSVRRQSALSTSQAVRGRKIGLERAPMIVSRAIVTGGMQWRCARRGRLRHVVEAQRADAATADGVGNGKAGQAVLHGGGGQATCPQQRRQEKRAPRPGGVQQASAHRSPGAVDEDGRTEDRSERRATPAFAVMDRVEQDAEAVIPGAVGDDREQPEAGDRSGRRSARSGWASTGSTRRDGRSARAFREGRFARGRLVGRAAAAGGGTRGIVKQITVQTPVSGSSR